MAVALQKSPKDDEFDDDDDDDDEEDDARGVAGPGEDWDNVDSTEALAKAVMIYDFVGM